MHHIQNKFDCKLHINLTLREDWSSLWSRTFTLILCMYLCWSVEAAVRTGGKEQRDRGSASEG